MATHANATYGERRSPVNIFKGAVLQGASRKSHAWERTYPRRHEEQSEKSVYILSIHGHSVSQ